MHRRLGCWKLGPRWREVSHDNTRIWRLSGRPILDRDAIDDKSSMSSTALRRSLDRDLCVCGGPASSSSILL